MRTVRGGFLPNAVVLLHDPGEAGAGARRVLPHLADKTMMDGAAAAYVCENYACRTPTVSAAELARQLAGNKPGA